MQADVAILAILFIFFSWSTSHVQQITAKNGLTYVIYKASYAKAKLITFLFMPSRGAVYL